MSRVAIVDDDEGYAALLKTLMDQAGHESDAYPSAGRFLDSLAGRCPDLVLLDLQMPGVDGWDLIELLRRKPDTRQVPLVALTGRYRSSKDVARALQLGADEYLTKPANSGVLLARVEALLRRSAWRAQDGVRASAAPLQAGPFSLDPEARTAAVAGRDLALTPTEFLLLEYMLRNVSRVLTRRLILLELRPAGNDAQPRAVDKHIESLRRKFGPFAKHLVTVSRAGYILRP